jgi:hypothetical protein
MVRNTETVLLCVQSALTLFGVEASRVRLPLRTARALLLTAVYNTAAAVQAACCLLVYHAGGVPCA